MNRRLNCCTNWCANWRSNWCLNWKLTSADRSTRSSSSPDTPALDSKPRSLSRGLWIAYMVSALAVVPGLVLWDTHQTRQITHTDDLGLAKDVQWLGTSGKHWLMRTPTGAVLTLESPRGGWAMEPNTRLVRTTSAHGKRWVCDASMQHCLRVADKQHTLTGAQPS